MGNSSRPHLHPIQLGGRVSASEQVRMTAVAGPRIARLREAGLGLVPGPPAFARAFGALFAPRNELSRSYFYRLDRELRRRSHTDCYKTLGPSIRIPLLL